MEDTNLAAMYQANVYPIYLMIDRDGSIARTQRGAAGEQALRRLLMRAGPAAAAQTPTTNSLLLRLLPSSR